MLYRGSIGAIALLTVLCATMLDASAFDDAKYPDLKGQWVRAEGARGVERRLPIAMALFACFALSRGVYDLIRAGRVRRKIDEQGEDDDDDD